MLIAPERAVLGSEYFCFNELPESLALLRSHRAYLSQIIRIATLSALFNMHLSCFLRVPR
jgi:hypothetical protein